VLTITGCVSDSPLSDLPVSDPSLIKPNIKLTRERSSSGTLNHDIKVFLYDKNHNSIELMKGEVIVNGIPLSVHYLPFTDAPYYTLDSFSVDLGQTYTVQIVLADGLTYISDVTVQENDFWQLILPETHNHTEDLPVSWSTPSASYPVKMYLSYFYTTGTGSGSGVRLISVPTTNAGTGNFIIPASYLSVPNGNIYRIDLEVVSTATGTVDGHFMSGGEITAQVSITGTCNIQ